MLAPFSSWLVGALLAQGFLATDAQPPPPYTIPYPPYTAPPPLTLTLPSTPPYSQPPPAIQYSGYSTPQQAPATPPSSAQGAIGSAGAQGSGYAQGLPKPPFPLGAASAAYQVEGAAAEDGRGPSIWDTFSEIPGKILNGDTGTVADDFYHRYAGDIATLQNLGCKMFRLSISWSRVLPTGSGTVNYAGLNFYNSLIDALIAAGIQPHVTLYHWDLPQALEDSYGGWLNTQIIADYTAFAKLMFTTLGDRVKHWTTFNEPQTFIEEGYINGQFAPGRCSDRSTCQYGNSNTEPWIVLKNVLLAHGSAVAQLRSISPGAMVSMNININWPVPLTNSSDDQAAALRYLDFHMGIYSDPLFLGNFPQTVLDAGLYNLTLSSAEQALLKGSIDYFALNHYTSNYVTSYNGNVIGGDELQETDGANFGNTAVYAANNGVQIGPLAQSNWLFVYPAGMRAILNHVKQRYGNPIIYVTENGYDVPGESSMPLQQALNDTQRIDFYQGYIQNAIAAVEQDGVNVQGYFVWSLLDNFEWVDGFEYRFGIVHVDYSTLLRYVKESGKFLAAWFSGSTTSVSNPQATAG